MPQLKNFSALIAIVLLVLMISGCNSTVTRPATATTRLVGYLPDYDVSYAEYAKSYNFNGLTHLILSVDRVPACDESALDGATSLSDHQTNADIAAIVTAAHAQKVKVLVTFYGDSTTLDMQNCYDNGHTSALVDDVDLYVKTHNLDGVDLDIEDPDHLGTPYDAFASVLETRMHGEERIVTAAVSEWIQGGMLDSTLHSFDFINMMNYSTTEQAVAMLKFYNVDHGEPAEKIVLGVPFFGTGQDDSTTESYANILAAYPDAWNKDYESGGALDGGMGFSYVGESSMATQTLLGKQYGGVMVWELSLDAPAPHSLLAIIKQNLQGK